MDVEQHYSYVKKLQNYSKFDPECKVKFILNNFKRFLKLVDGFEATWGIIVKAEKRYNSAAGSGDLGVRVQKSGYSNPTMQEAMFNMEMERAKTESELGSIVKGTDNPNQHIWEKHIIQDMRDDYSIMVNAIHELDQLDEEMFLRYLKKEDVVRDIADKCNIQYSSAKRKIYDIRKTVILTAAENIELKYRIINREVADDEQ